jgi:putative ABC transport system permease protein
MATAVSWAGLAVSLLLVAAAAGISWWQRLGLQRPILIAAARALGQLLLVGAALTPVISPGRSIWWSWLWVGAMLGYAATVARRRAPKVPHLLTRPLPPSPRQRRSRWACRSGCMCSRSPAAPWCPSPG